MKKRGADAAGIPGGLVAAPVAHFLHNAGLIAAAEDVDAAIGLDRQGNGGGFLHPAAGDVQHTRLADRGRCALGTRQREDGAADRFAPHARQRSQGIITPGPACLLGQGQCGGGGATEILQGEGATEQFRACEACREKPGRWLQRLEMQWLETKRCHRRPGGLWGEGPLPLAAPSWADRLP